MSNNEQQALMAALSWHIEAGADEALATAPVDATRIKAPAPSMPPAAPMPKAPAPSQSRPLSANMPPASADTDYLGASEARTAAIEQARAADSLPALRAAIESFDGLSIKKTAARMVFGSGPVKPAVMILGEAPGSDEERSGMPYAGPSGQLLQKMLAAIGINLETDGTPEKAAYLSYLLNWRPPGNRPLTSAETDVSLPFAEQHIALVRPSVLILTSGTVAKAILRTSEPPSRLRGKFHDYQLSSTAGDSAPAIPAMFLYDPAFLLQNPRKKQAAWQDLLMLKARLEKTDGAATE